MLKMLAECDISPGGSIPSLRRLLANRLVSMGISGPRNRGEYRLTTTGRAALRKGWKDLLDQGPTGDLDSDLRMVLLASEMKPHECLSRDLCKPAPRGSSPRVKRPRLKRTRMKKARQSLGVIGKCEQLWARLEIVRTPKPQRPLWPCFQNRSGAALRLPQLLLEDRYVLPNRITDSQYLFLESHT